MSNFQTHFRSFRDHEHINKIGDESLQGLDLSSLRMVANGAEPAITWFERTWAPPERFPEIWPGRWRAADAVPVPIYPPARASQVEDHLKRHAGILSNALTEILITVPQAKPLAPTPPKG